MPHIRIVTDKPVAFESPDHIQPWGTARDNSVNLKFNRKLFAWISPYNLRILDLGCAGGGFVKSVLEKGGFAVGVEGSDYSKLRKRAEWATIPDFLFTADITEPFSVLLVDENGCEHPMKFNLITAWEVMEHIQKTNLHNVFQNISYHLSPNGLVIVSINTNEDIVQGVRLHQTVETREWWISKVLSLGFVHHEEILKYFGMDWIRGGYNTPGSFHFVMTRKGENPPSMSRLRILIFLTITIRSVRSMLINATPSLLKRAYRNMREISWRRGLLLQFTRRLLLKRG